MGAGFRGLHCIFRFLPFLPAQKLVSGFLQGGGRRGDMYISDLFLWGGIHFISIKCSFKRSCENRMWNHVRHYQIHQWFVLRCVCFVIVSRFVLLHTHAHAHFFPNCLRIGWRHSVFMSEQAYSLTNHGCTLSKIRRLSTHAVLTRIHRTYSDFISCPSNVLYSRRLPGAGIPSINLEQCPSLALRLALVILKRRG